ncbi:hypothetical protein SETIT_4G181600v2 [Setaria italica]|uniref:Biopterin-dependent aromatic amino acid hydroxylase family profile domain-containing protein n=1 Tax=Setaria italica TaxID=4555 RepID=K3Y4G9_SETIT|nr:hypothetical protein SETIT_4G181600v2 [Setaria italica]
MPYWFMYRFSKISSNNFYVETEMIGVGLHHCWSKLAAAL